MDQHLCVAVNTLIKLRIRVGSIFDFDVVTDDLAGLGPSVENEIPPTTCAARVEQLFERIQSCQSFGASVSLRRKPPGKAAWR